MCNFKKILCLVLVGMIMFSLSGCLFLSSEDKPKEEIPVNKEYESAVKEFITAYKAYDFEKAGTYLTDSKYSKGIFEYKSEEAIKANFIETFVKKRWSEEQLDQYTTNLIKMYDKNKKYEITGSKEENDTFVVTIKYTYSDLEQYNKELSAIGLKYKDKITEDPETHGAYDELIAELIEVPKAFNATKEETKTIVLKKTKDGYKIDVTQKDFEEIFANSYIK